MDNDFKPRQNKMVYPPLDPRLGSANRAINTGQPSRPGSSANNKTADDWSELASDMKRSSGRPGKGRFKISPKASIVGLTAVVLSLAIGGYAANRYDWNRDTNKQRAAAINELDFAVLTPQGVGPESVNEPNVQTVDSGDRVFVFSDVFAGVRLRVSQQSMPDEFWEDRHNNLANLAADFALDQVIEDRGVTIYYGLSGGRRDLQTVASIKGKTMIFVHAKSKLADEDWVAYIGALR